ncbi:MAG: hypothetical protein Q8O48_10880, partial [Anaerolineales bacterium]|nr:hypothetical protein [Anaerolineales bacterium]
MAAKEKRAGNRQTDCQRTTEIQITLPALVKNGGVILRRVSSPLDAMHKFYEEVVELEMLKREESFVLFKIAEGYGGHTQNLSLFEASNTMFLDNKAVQ